MQKNKRVLKNYISIISVYENQRNKHEIKVKNRENASCGVKNWPTAWISACWSIFKTTTCQISNFEYKNIHPWQETAYVTSLKTEKQYASIENCSRRINSAEMMCLCMPSLQPKQFFGVFLYQKNAKQFFQKNADFSGGSPLWKKYFCSKCFRVCCR